MKLNELIKLVKKRNLINTIRDLPWTPWDKDKTLPLEDLIDDSIRWSYENDDLHDFYSEHLERLFRDEIVSPLIQCSISYDTTMGNLSDYIYLFCFESKNKKYYFKILKGITTDYISEYETFEIIDKNSDIDVILNFKAECNEVTSDGTIEFYI